MNLNFDENDALQNENEFPSLVYCRNYTQFESMSYMEKKDYINESLKMLDEISSLPFLSTIDKETAEDFIGFSEACDKLAQMLSADITIDIVDKKNLAFVGLYKYSYELSFPEITILMQILIAAANVDIQPAVEGEDTSCLGFFFDFSYNSSNFLHVTK